MTLWDRHYSVHFTNGETNVRRGLVPPSRSHSWPGTRAPVPLLLWSAWIWVSSALPWKCSALCNVAGGTSTSLLAGGSWSRPSRQPLLEPTGLGNTCTAEMLRAGISESAQALPLNSKGTKTLQNLPQPSPPPPTFFFFKEKWKNLIITSIYHPTVLITNLFLHSVTDTSSGKHIEIN